MKKKTYISITSASVELKICTSNISDIYRKKKNQNSNIKKRRKQIYIRVRQLKKLQLQKII